MQVHIALGWAQGSTSLPGEGQVLSCHVPLEGLAGRTVRFRVAAGLQ